MTKEFHFKENGLTYFTLRIEDITRYSVTFNVKETVSWDSNNNNVCEEEDYLDGYVKWDSCSLVNITADHFCGVKSWKRHCAVMEWIYKTVTAQIEGMLENEKWI